MSKSNHISTNKRSSTTSLSNFMPQSATLPCMRHVFEYLSRTFENNHLAISPKTISVMNCECLAFSCYWAQPKSHLYKQRTATTSLSNFMPESATLPCMRHLLGYLSQTFENHLLAISLKTLFVMNCECLAFSCYWAQPKSHLYKQRPATTSLSNFMPESATLPCMRHLFGYLSQTFENHLLAISP